MMLGAGLKILKTLSSQENLVILVLLGVLLVSWGVAFGVILVLWKDIQGMRKEHNDISTKMLTALLTFDGTLTKVIENGSRDYDSLKDTIKTQCEILLAKLT